MGTRSLGPHPARDGVVARRQLFAQEENQRAVILSLVGSVG